MSNATKTTADSRSTPKHCSARRTRPLRASLTAAAIITACHGLAAAAQDIDLRLVARGGDQIPGGPAGQSFGFIHDVSITPTGEAVFRTQDIEFGQFAGTPGSLRRIARG